METLKTVITHSPTSVEKIFFRELTDDNDFEQCINLQRSIFKLSDTQVISPLLLKLIARKNPPVGLAIGIFNHSELIGFVIGLSAFEEKSIYITMLGIKSKYQNRSYGFKLFLKFRETALANNINRMYCVFNPLESHLSYLYCSKLGFTGIKLEIESIDPEIEENLNNIPEGKLLTIWNMNSPKTIDKLNKVNVLTLADVINKYPIATCNYMPNSKKILFEIPENYNLLKKTDYKSAELYRINSQHLFQEYLNNRKYLITDCFSEIIHNQRKTFYLLEKL